MIAIYLALTFILGCYCDQVPSVQTPLGAVSGYYKTSHGGRKYAAFEGIPYAVPPIGERRFEEAEPVGPWLGVWNATSTSVCAQTDLYQPYTPSGEEDCLHINVYVPRTNPDPSESLDVIVHIHGGAYMYGNGHEYYPPHFLMDREVIYVNFNYRLGILGFLSTEDEVVPGNNGMKDQVLALKWVQNNIASFGGNPNSVTLNGLSAGGSAVHLHYFSERSRGLFHRGFSQSGFALNPWSVAEEPLSKAKKLANLVGCPTDSTRMIVDCLKERPFQQLLGQMSSFFAFYFLPIVPFGPVIEKAGFEPFLKADPYYLLSKGQVLDVPWIGSVTKHKGIFPAEYIGDLHVVEEKWDEVAPYLLDFNYTVPKSLWSSTAKKIKEYCFGESKINKENVLKLAKILTDRYFLNGGETSAKLQAKMNKSPVYFYVFGYPGDNNERKTVPHGGDCKYFVGNTQFSPDPFTSNELKMSKLMLDWLTNYAKSGEVVMDGVDWRPTGFDKLTYLSIDGVEPGDNKLETAEELSSTKFWDELHLAEGENLIRRKDEL